MSGLRQSPRRVLARVRKICRAFPETGERLSHGSPTFFIRSKKAFVMFLDNHRGDGRLALWCAAPRDMQRVLVETEDAYLAHRAQVTSRGDSGTWSASHCP